MGAVGIADVRI